MLTKSKPTHSFEHKNMEPVDRKDCASNFDEELKKLQQLLPNPAIVYKITIEKAEHKIIAATDGRVKVSGEGVDAKYEREPYYPKIERYTTSVFEQKIDGAIDITAIVKAVNGIS
jgi:hypothetical protein